MTASGQVLLAATYTTAALRDMYTVPAGATDRVEFLSLDWETAGGSHFSFGAKRSGVYRAFAVHDFAGPDAWNWLGRAYLAPGDVLWLYQPTAGTVNVWVSGVRFT